MVGLREDPRARTILRAAVFLAQVCCLSFAARDDTHANATGCRIVSPVSGTAVTVDSTSALFISTPNGNFVQFDAHLYNISPKDLPRLQDPAVHVWPGITHTDFLDELLSPQEATHFELDRRRLDVTFLSVDGDNDDLFYVSSTPDGGADIFTRFVVLVREELMQQPFTVSFRWALRPSTPDDPTVSGVCAGVYQFLAPTVNAPTDSAADRHEEPISFGSIAVAHDEICSDPHYCSPEYKSLLTESARYDLIDAEQILAEPRVCDPSCTSDEQGCVHLSLSLARSLPLSLSLCRVRMCRVWLCNPLSLSPPSLAPYPRACIRPYQSGAQGEQLRHLHKQASHFQDIYISQHIASPGATRYYI